MPSVGELRALGPSELTGVLTLRPEVLGQPAPRSLAELSARLGHPAMLSAALSHLNLPDLEVCEALASLGPEADRPRLERLLGIADADDRAGLERVLERLSARVLLRRDACRLEGPLEDGWPAPLGLGSSLREILPRMTVTQLGSTLTTWGVRLPDPLRKPRLVEALLSVLTDSERVRAAVSTAPEPLPERLTGTARGRDPVVRGLYRLPWSSSFGSAPRADPVSWATDRLLVVPTYTGTVEMPAEVVVALRGAGWRAPFTSEPPTVEWAPVEPDAVRRAADSAGARAVRVVADMLRLLRETPLGQLKNGDVGARELRRLAKAVDLPPEDCRLLLALTHHIGLAAHGKQGFETTGDGLRWLELAPGRALATLVQGWATMPDVPTDAVDLPWAPTEAPGLLHLRRETLALLGERRDAAPAGDEELLAAVRWRAPLQLGYRIGGSDAVDEPSWADVEDGLVNDPDDGEQLPDPDPDADADLAAAAAATLRAMLAEAAFLGVLGAGALSPVGAAVLAGAAVDSVEAAAGPGLGSSQDDVVVQADLTATVLGHPSARLTAVLDRTADRESRSAATVWRFGATSVRRAFDAGYTADDVVAELSAVSRTELPQALTYLVRDVARQHGRLRAGTALSYLRSDDSALLAEVAADRRLRRLGLRLLAPTVLVSDSTVADLVTALRAAGHGPVEEGPDGAPVLRRPTPPPAGGEPAPPRRRRHVPHVERVDPATLARQLLAEPDKPRQLLDVGPTVIDVDSLRDWSRGR